MAGVVIPSLYLDNSGIPGAHCPLFSSSDKASWLHPNSCTCNSLPSVLSKGATHFCCCTLPHCSPLVYPHKNVMVWIHDANLSLAKYIPLALVALLFLLLLFIPYTLLPLLGQWLQTKSHLHLLSGSRVQN